jgi:rod shape-determining protein MreC
MQKFFRNLIENFREYITLIALLLVSLFLLSLNNKPGIEHFRSVSFGMFAYVTSAVHSAANIFTDDDEINKLKLANAELMLEVNKLRNYALQNSHLRRMLELKDTTTYSLVAADVISKLTSKIEGNFIVNVGKKEGVGIGMPVIDEVGLIGIVVDVADNFSSVRTLENVKLNIAVTNQRSNINGILSWNGQRHVIKNIPTTYDMKVGDRIETSSFSTILPPSIPVGVIEEKDTEVSGLLSNIYVKPFSDIKSVENLFIVKVIENDQIDSLEMNLLKKQ